MLAPSSDPSASYFDRGPSLESASGCIAMSPAAGCRTTLRAAPQAIFLGRVSAVIGVSAGNLSLAILGPTAATRAPPRSGLPEPFRPVDAGPGGGADFATFRPAVGGGSWRRGSKVLDPAGLDVSSASKYGGGSLGGSPAPRRLPASSAGGQLAVAAVAASTMVRIAIAAAAAEMGRMDGAVASAVSRHESWDHAAPVDRSIVSLDRSSWAWFHTFHKLPHAPSANRYDAPVHTQTLHCTYLARGRHPLAA